MKSISYYLASAALIGTIKGDVQAFFVPAPPAAARVRGLSASKNKQFQNPRQSHVSYKTKGDGEDAPVDLEVLVKPRPYGLFLAEKAAEFVEGKRTRRKGQSDPQNTGEESSGKQYKEKVVILGTGWGSAAFLKTIDTDMYDVTVVSPRNYFLFTPMLAGASVGTVAYRSIIEPVREINRNAAYLEGTAVYIDTKGKTVTVKPVECEGNNAPCTINDVEEITYDHLIYSIGAKTNTFGTPGVEEYCNFLKQVGDARKIRAAVVNCFERASFHDLTDAERTKLLTFVIIGAGPSGIEFAAELRDFIEQDGPKYYPDLLKNVRIKVIEGSNTVLAPFHKTLQQEAIQKLNSQAVITDPDVKKLLPPRFKLTDLMLESFVKKVTEDNIELTDGTMVPYGMAVWAAGNAPLELTLDLIEDLGPIQKEKQSIARGRIATDPWLRALGSDGSIISIGDASCVVHNQLPATGQVASQQGEYVARLLNKQYDLSPANADAKDGILAPPVHAQNATTQNSLADLIASLSTKTEKYAKPFQFLNLGILAYTGRDTALAQVTTAPNLEPITATGKIGSELWKSVYLWKQVSWRNRIMVVSDWFNRQIFGRDISHLE